MRRLVEGEARSARRFGVMLASPRSGASAPRAGHIVPAADPAPGAHLVTRRRGYTHHGIYAGDGKVVHYAGLFRALHRGPVEEISLEDFAGGQPVFVQRDEPAHYPAELVVARARSRLGEDRYRITTNNCEHFCEWCLHGTSRSRQIERFVRWPLAVAGSAFRALRQLAWARESARASAV